MSAASTDGPLTAAELAVMRQLDTGPGWQLLADVAGGAGLATAATAQAIRRLHYLHGFVTPADPRAEDTTAGAWSLTTLGEARLLREPPQLDVAA
jgi:hypothetical protein